MDEEAANAVECLVNLLYLIRMQAAVPTDVLLFVDMAQKPMETLVATALGERRAKREPEHKEPTP